MLCYVPWAIWLGKSWIVFGAVSLVPQGNHCGKLANEITFFLCLRFGLPFKTGALVPVCHWRQIVIEEYLIVACNFIGRRLVSPVSCIFMKTRFCQWNCLRYVWGVTGERTVGADDATFNNSQQCYFVAVKTQLFSRNICIITSLADPGGAAPTTPPTPNDSGPMILLCPKR